MRNNGAVTRPAPYPVLDLNAINSIPQLLKIILILLSENSFLFQTLKSIQEGGLFRLHMDSWEMGAQNWSDNFREEFENRRGYDLLPFLPVYAGEIVDNKEISERFLWDLRMTAKNLSLKTMRHI